MLSVEFVGTLCLELAFNLRISPGPLAGIYFVILLCTILISGGHLNPAITLAVWIEQKEFWANGLFTLGIITA